MALKSNTTVRKNGFLAEGLTFGRADELPKETQAAPVETDSEFEPKDEENVVPVANVGTVRVANPDRQDVSPSADVSVSKKKTGPIPYATLIKQAQEAGLIDNAVVAQPAHTMQSQMTLTAGALQALSSFSREPRSERISCSVTPTIRDLLDQEVRTLNIRSINDLINFLLEQYFAEKARIVSETLDQQ